MKTYTHNLLSAAVVAALTFSGAAIADEYQTLETTTVTAGRFEQDLMETPMSVSVVTREQIEQSNARNVGELLELLPGIQINNDGGQGMKRIKIRGENAFRTLVMIDGQKVSEQKSMSGAPMLIDPAMIERIEVIKGPASVLYGSDAIGGAINIITKKGGTKPLQGEVSGGMNTSASGTNAAAAVYGSVNGWKYRLSAAVEDNDNLETPMGEMPNTYFTARSASGFLSYDITPDATVGLNLDYYDLEFGSGNYGDEYFAVDVPEWKRTKAAIFGEVKNISDVLVRVRTDAFYQKSKKQMINTVGGVWTQQEVDAFTQMGFDPRALQQMGVFAGNRFTLKPNADNDIDQYGFSVQSDWQLGESNFLIAGYEFNYDKLDARSWNEGTNVMPMMKTNRSYDGYQMLNALFMSMETYLPHDISLNYGVRYTWVKTDMDIVNNNTHTKTSNDSSDGKAVFNAGILWRTTDNLSVRATYAQGFRSPILQELYIDTSMGQAMSTTKANPDLKPETSDNFEIGARWLSKALTADGAIFYSDTDDYIATVFKASSRSYQYDNVAKAKTFGAELSLAYRIAETGFEPYTVLTWMRRQYDNGTGFKTYDTATPELMARYGMRWTGEHDGLGLRADVYARSLTKTKYASADSSNNYSLAGYTTLNLTGGVSFGEQKQYSLDAGFYNIFDKAYREQTAIYEPGRYLAIKLNAKF